MRAKLAPFVERGKATRRRPSPSKSTRKQCASLTDAAAMKGMAGEAVELARVV
jgi:hypothetical protein